MSIIAVAQRAGVSIATVSRAFNSPDLVMPATRHAIEAAADALGYVPNLSARTLRTSRSHTLGVLLPTLYNPVFAECLAGIAAAAAGTGFSILPATTDYDERREQQGARALLARAVDGVILTVANAADSATLDHFRHAGVPYVLAYNRHADHPCVSVDGRAAMRELVERLLRDGHRRIAMFSGTLAASDRARQRFEGYEQAMQASGCERELIEVPFVVSAVDTLVERLRAPQRPTAVVCSNDLLAVRCLRAASLAGLAVPRDLSVVGFDGIGIGADLSPSLASIAQPNERIGHECVRLLVDAIERGERPCATDSLTLAHELRALESLGPVFRKPTPGVPR